MSTPDDSPAARVHLDVLGQQRTITVDIPQGEQPVSALLPAARRLSEQIVSAAVEAAAGEGRRVSCRAGCGACCRQLVVISLTDAEALGQLVATMPAERQAVIRHRFATAIARLETAGLLDANEPKGDRHLIQRLPDGVDQRPLPLAQRYFQLQIACPFLEDESCGIYDDRPLVCREYLVTSPAEDCSRLFELPIARIETPVRMGDVMIRLTHQIAGARLEGIPIVLALEWAAAHAHSLGRPEKGLTMLQLLVSATQAEHRRTQSSEF
jgi:Fe-S-cluster containining protein